MHVKVGCSCLEAPVSSWQAKEPASRDQRAEELCQRISRPRCIGSSQTGGEGGVEMLKGNSAAGGSTITAATVCVCGGGGVR